ncbi:MAG TPA: protein kinase [Polyangiales bacterium]|nr:protein kinase [Polyangiales bacterium]
MGKQAASAGRASVPPIQGRYRVETELARGAMGAVYRVFDPVTQRSLALKRALGNDRRFLGMFEREYHTLRGLKHPSIIEVYDYGVDEQGAYYTMELLQGRDLGELAPLDYRSVCRYLRDVASSLGLLHARRMLHRDLSPRNVRVSDSGRCKLLDFGVLSGFGVPELVVGTPPFIPPESLHRLALDQRADLFGLGAVAYSLLTGSHAYPARSLAVLSDVWRRTPQRPSELVAKLGKPELPPIPAELDELVMSLLTLDPLGRPGSVAEVIDRLNRIGDLPSDADAVAVARSYLVGVQTVGRAHELERLRERLARAVEGRGGSVLIEARAGLGSTRLISDLAVEAQLAGALPVVIDAAVRGDSFGAVHELIDKLLTSAHDASIAAASGYGPMLARLSPALRQALDVTPDATDFTTTPSELRRRQLAAVGGWLARLCPRRPLLIAIDNAHALDDASGALLAMLANEAGTAHMLVVMCVKTEQLDSAPSSVRALLHGHAGTRLRLQPLSVQDVDALVRLWFGDVEGVERLADRLHRVSGGNVRVCSELAEHLVQTAGVRHIQGAWVLPAEIGPSDLPAGAAELQAVRIRELPDAERRLTEALAVHNGRVPLARCLQIAASESIADPYTALENLVRARVLHLSGNAYALSYEALRDAVLEQITPERKRALHLRMGALIAESDNPGVMHKLDAGWHLLHGGERERGAALLAEGGLSLGYSSDDLASALPALKAALEVYRDPKHSDYDRVRLLCPLTLASFFADRRLGNEYGPEAIATFQRVLGLRMYARLAPRVGRHLAFFSSLAIAALRFAFRKGSGGIAGFHDLIVRCIAAITSLCATAAVCLDRERAAQIAESLAPFRLLGEKSGAAYALRFARLLAIVPTESVSEIIVECRSLLARLDDPRPIPLLPEPARDALRAGVLQMFGVMELFCADPDTLAIADRLERTGMAQDRATADQLRLSYHALRGESKLAQTYRRKVEMNAIQGGTLWLFEIWSPSFFILVYINSQDTIGLKTVAERLDRLVRDVPSLGHDAIMVRAEYHHLKGDHETAFAISKPVLDSTADRSFIGRSSAMAQHCRGLNQLQRHAEARVILTPLIQRLSEADRRVASMYIDLFREYAFALAGLGDFAQAFSVLDENLARYAPSEHPLVLGNLHGAAAMVAIMAGDARRAIEHANEVGRWFRGTENPVLVARYEKLSRRVRAMAAATPVSTELYAPGPANDQLTVDVQSALSRLSQLMAADERAELALRMLLDHIHADAGYLFVNKGDSPSLIAPLHGEEPTPPLLTRVATELRGASEVDEQTVATRHDRISRGDSSPQLSTQALYVIHPLVNGARVLGALAALQPEERPLRRPRPAFFSAVASALFEVLETSAAADSNG